MIFNPLQANKEIQRLGDVVKALERDLSTEKAEKEDLQKTIESFVDEKNGIDKKLTDQQAKQETAISDLTADYEKKLAEAVKQKESVVAEVKKVEEVANEKAVEIVANLGVDPKVLPVDSNPVVKTLTPQEAAETFNTLSKEGKNVEASEFYAKNKSLILKGMNIRE